MLVTLGARATGERVVLDLRLVGEESAASWTEVVASFTARHLARPVLAVIDGNPGLIPALRSHWPGIEIQRCTAHKLRNLQSKVPLRLCEELTEDCRGMIYGQTVAIVQEERTRFTKKWQLRCGEPEGSRRRVLYLSALSAVAVEGAAHDQRARAHQRRGPPAHQDARGPAWT